MFVSRFLQQVIIRRDTLLQYCRIRVDWFGYLFDWFIDPLVNNMHRNREIMGIGHRLVDCENRHLSGEIIGIERQLFGWSDIIDRSIDRLITGIVKWLGHHRQEMIFGHVHHRLYTGMKWKGMVGTSSDRGKKNTHIITSILKGSASEMLNVRPTSIYFPKVPFTYLDFAHQ